jgi:hypothetical protein
VLCFHYPTERLEKRNKSYLRHLSKTIETLILVVHALLEHKFHVMHGFGLLQQKVFGRPGKETLPLVAGE